MNHPLITVIIGNTHTSCLGWSLDGVAGDAVKWKTADVLAAHGAAELEVDLAVYTSFRLLAAPGATVLLAGVVPKYQPLLKQWLVEKSYDVRVFREDVIPRIEIVPVPAQNVGDDRIAGALGALALYPATPAIVVDAGTALTVNAVIPSKDGAPPRFEGGLIIPGQNLMLQALALKTGRLPELEIDPNRESAGIIGRSTEQALLWGAWHAYSAGALAAVNGQSHTLGKGTRVLLTGGGALALAPTFRMMPEAFSVEVQPQLVHRGLFAAWQEKDANG